MKIAVPINEDHTTVCVSFARAPEFVLVDSETGARTYLKNEATDADSGAGIQASQALIDHEADVVLMPRCGENAGKVLAAGEITIYKTTSDDLAGELKKFAQGELEVLTQMHPGFHGHGFG